MGDFFVALIPVAGYILSVGMNLPWDICLYRAILFYLENLRWSYILYKRPYKIFNPLKPSGYYMYNLL
jgi:hypothetical protein